MSHLDHLVPINNICNQKCNFCSAAERMEWGETIPLKDIFKQILEKDSYIQISGWEPLLHPKVFEIVYFARTQKPDAFIEFQTNGVFLLRKNNLNNLLKLWVNLFNINYPCHIESVNDAIAQTKNTLKLREESMHAILERGWKLRINIIVTKLNYLFLPEMVDYLVENFSGFDRIQMSFTKAMWAAKWNDIVVPQYEEASPFLIGALKKSQEYGIRIDVDHIPMCFLGPYYQHHVDYGKLKKGEKWVFLEEKHFIKKCDWCDKRPVCSWYRDDYLKVYPYATA